MDGPGATLINMALLGIVAQTYVILVGGDMSGPILGGILTVFGFGAFGAHLRNYIPVLAGVWLSTTFTMYDCSSYAEIISALFVVGLSPIAGQYGPVAGVIAGVLHNLLVMTTGQLYGGLNLYNNGFSCGWIAIVMVPLIESFRQHRKLMKLVRAERMEHANEEQGELPNRRRRLMRWIMRKEK